MMMRRIQDNKSDESHMSSINVIENELQWVMTPDYSTYDFLCYVVKHHSHLFDPTFQWQLHDTVTSRDDHLTPDE